MQQDDENGVSAITIGGDIWITFKSGDRVIRILKEDIGSWTARKGVVEAVAGISLAELHDGAILHPIAESALIRVLKQIAPQ